MKNILLGTSALVAAGLMVAPAAAQEGVQLGLGGFYFGAVGGNFDESGAPSDRQDDVEFKQQVEVHFDGETTLDNGITVGARVELEGFRTTDVIDEAYARFSGGFGEVRFGDDDDAYAQLCYLVPTASSAFGADSPFLNFSNAGTNGTCYGLSGDSTKLIYFTPSFGGLQLAGSYAADDHEASADNFTGTEVKDGGLQDIYSAALTYATEIDAFSIAVGGGGSWAKYEDPASDLDDPAHYNAYVQGGFAGWTIGAVYNLRENDLGDNLDSEVYGAGVTYGFEAWTVGLGWTHGEYDDGATLGFVPVDELDIYQFTAAYALGPGVTVDAMVGYNDGAAVAGGEDYESVEAGVGFGLSF
ncbi:porin [Rhodospirillaceae bacterium SYSU D60014]|uniref:porin n=1 Tax=Virgifigura deserti TaxID=2268457 RepID=UPI000E663031